MQQISELSGNPQQKINSIQTIPRFLRTYDLNAIKFKQNPQNFTKKSTENYTVKKSIIKKYIILIIQLKKAEKKY